MSQYLERKQRDQVDLPISEDLEIVAHKLDAFPSHGLIAAFDFPFHLTELSGRQRPGEHAAVVELDLALITPLVLERVVLVLHPTGQHAAHLSAVGVAADADRPLVAADRAQVLLGLAPAAPRRPSGGG